MTESPISDDELQLYFDYINNQYVINEPFAILDAEISRQYSAEELALEVV